MSEYRAQLTMTAGPVPGSVYLIEKPEIYLGRDLVNELPIPEPEISRRHARIFMQNNLIFIEDLGSTNGTFVNGTRISSPQELQAGDRITLAEKTSFSFEYSGASTAQAPMPPTPTAPIYTQPQPTPPHQEVFQPVVAPVPERELAPEPEFTKPPKKRHGCLVFLLIVLAIVVLTALVLVFMPESWWCAITFNGLPGCPVR